MQFHDVAALDELPEGGLRQVTVDGAPVLLHRAGDTVHAVGAICPHAGGPLIEGVLHDGRIVCPWHKAAFCIRTGALLDPPAVDALDPFEARVEQGRVLVRPAPPAAPAAPPPADRRRFVIVGGGAAGAAAAQHLRELGFAGRLLLLDRENRVPYDRTLLSKYTLSGEIGGEKSPLQRQSYYRERNIERITAEVTRIDPAARTIHCADGTIHAYDAALLATGGDPVRPDIPGVGQPHVFLLRSRADAEAILAKAERSTRAVVLGAGFIGMEVAASLRERGLEVTVVAQQEAPFARQLGPRVGAAFVGLHARRGVRFRLGATAERIDPDAVVLPGELMPADLVVIGAGIDPATRGLGLKRAEDGGIDVDATMQVAPGLYAAGDIARFPLYGDGPLVRVEHWRVAHQHGRLAARNMLGAAARYDAPPVFWTIQYRKRLDYIGHAADWDEVVVHGDLEAPSFLAYYVKDGRVAAAVGMDRDRDTAALVELFTLRHDWTPEALGANPAALLPAPA